MLIRIVLDLSLCICPGRWWDRIRFFSVCIYVWWLPDSQTTNLFILICMYNVVWTRKSLLAEHTHTSVRKRKEEYQDMSLEQLVLIRISLRVSSVSSLTGSLETHLRNEPINECVSSWERLIYFLCAFDHARLSMAANFHICSNDYWRWTPWKEICLSWFS
jgi:hypothetical protein